MSVVGLYVDESNEHGIGQYQKMGFEMLGKCNHVEGRFFMNFDLEAPLSIPANVGAR